MRSVFAQRIPLDRVWRAWNKPGPQPRIHERAKRRLRKSWPALHDALELLDQSGPITAEDIINAYRTLPAWEKQEVHGVLFHTMKVKVGSRWMCACGKEADHG